MFAMIGTWLVLITPTSEPYHVLECKAGLSLEAASPAHVEHKAAVDRQRPLYNEVRQWKELQKCVHDHVHDKLGGFQLIPTSHRIRWSQATARRNIAFSAMSPEWHFICI